ncbi:MAG: helicase-related protein, partial [Gemmatimonadales bacterium]
IKDQCDAGRQAYVVYPVIEESERTDLKAATSMYEQLTDRFAPLQVGLVHGRIKPDDRDRVMRRFRDGEVGVLVATTVIEVGIDVPNATVMVIEHPERFGLAQLHQLRGRVGRGAAESHCILLRPDGPSLPRLDAFRRTQDGFTIAELDLKERGMGDLAGARQSGGLALRFTDLAEDAELVNAAQKLARDFLETDPHLSLPEHAAVRGRIERRYERGIELFRVG